MGNVGFEFTSFKNDVRANEKKSLGAMIIPYETAEEIVQEEVSKYLKEETVGNMKDMVLNEVKGKEWFYKREKKYKQIVADVIKEKGITVTGYETKESELIQALTAAFVGFSVLDEAMKNPDVSDIFVIEYDKIFVEEKGKNKRYPHHFKNAKDLEKFIVRIASETGASVDMAENKISDFELFGDRYCASSSAVTPDSFSLTIRKHPEEHITFSQIKASGTLTEEMAEFFKVLIKGGRNIIYAGITGSGKTTTIRAALEETIPELNRRALTCEDTPELYLTNPNTLRMVTSPATDSPKANKQLLDLIYAALRLKPYYIVIGEIRDEAACAAVEAMETGHSTIFTMHGGTSINCINRLVNKYLSKMPALGVEVTERIIGSAVDYIMVQDNIPGIGRRIVTIDEISYDYKHHTVKTTPIYKFDIVKKEFVKVNNISHEKANLMMRKGVSYDELKTWYSKDQVEREG